ncbi:MAG: helix-turn-helix domain-containing protein [Treponema sp.]|nr:helix-turn-helix domain-containing protein [Treponema sp.]
MKPLLAIGDRGQEVTVDERNIISRREMLPLFEKARQILRYYNDVMGGVAIVIDSSGNEIKAPDEKTQVHRVCRAGRACCIKNCGISDVKASSTLQMRNACPHWKTHQTALDESRNNDGVYIYSCEMGFVYWTIPLYLSGRYAGALIAGQVIANNSGDVDTERASMVECFSAMCNDTSYVREFQAVVNSAPLKTVEEIKALAQLLGLCAHEISERREETHRAARCKSWQSLSPKSSVYYGKPSSQSTQSKQNVAPSRSGLLERERLLVAAFRRGDNETGGKILKELMANVMNAMPGNLEVLRFRAIDLVALLSRSAISETHDNGALLETNNRYLSRIMESKTSDELIESLCLGAELMASKIFSFQGMRHASALRRAERYIWENYTRKLSLEEIAKASGLSAPYFSTIFKEEMGENLSSYLNRLRVEGTITLLSETGKPLSEIAKLCGFEDQSWFSKIFKNFTGISPGKFREKGVASFYKQKE